MQRAVWKHLVTTSPPRCINSHIPYPFETRTAAGTLSRMQQHFSISRESTRYPLIFCAATTTTFSVSHTQKMPHSHVYTGHLRGIYHSRICISEIRGVEGGSGYPRVGSPGVYYRGWVRLLLAVLFFLLVVGICYYGFMNSKNKLEHFNDTSIGCSSHAGLGCGWFGCRRARLTACFI